MNLEECLPAELRGPHTMITRVGAGLSGAGVYRVEATGQTFVLKVSADSEPVESWRYKVQIQRAAAQAGLAPRVVHVDEAGRAITSAFVVDRGFPALFGDPRTRAVAIALLGRTVRRVHGLPLPAEVQARDPRAFLATVWTALDGFPLPAFVGEAVERVLGEEPPPSDRTEVLSHNDVNPTNLIYDGDHLLLLDWETAGPNDPYYDLAAISVFFRMDEATCQSLVAAYDAAPPAPLPARLQYDRRLVAALCGSTFLYLARQNRHPGASGAETLESTAGLSLFYERLRSGALVVASAEGQWEFGLALAKASLEL
jgi:aminoglycoside phosphotransferase